ncbi:TetR/AcrR family transcriptional regulator C-terminal domain-containing protein [Microtetraspora sp. AC03309]|uniref:TetR/AcrR family transcriptional regulator n=1 Tax=Microtetraspora sp. AC03309 TaxID=2779376 RepID=UPI001E4E32AE|nr:TetR/AcrR family transcriptional regulator [Microtetraspora sp. AC03309]MCC5579487.1 TetR/AcrR family transcriptional regulator C-terminal domain-containing protein [Microtetraspora sp. AC03309]
MPRPRSLTPAQLASAALAVIDREGLAGLSMRAVAQQVGMSTMALYRYIDDREELEQLVIESVLGAVDTTPPATDGSWQERIEILVHRVRDSVGAHPGVVPLIITHRHRSAGLMRWSESVVGILTEAGLDGRKRVIALRCLLAYVVGAVQLEHLGSLAGSGTEGIADLSRTEFPHLADTARRARAVDADEEFHGGLATLLRGMET